MNNERLNTMRNRIENVGLEDAGVDEGLVAEIIDELIDSRYQIATLAAERDEARKEVENVNIKLSGAWNLVINNDEFDRCISSLKILYGIAAEHAASHETKNAARDVLEVCGVAEKMRDGCVSRDAQIDSLTAELAALKSCPAMAEVDALVKEIDPSIDLDALDLNPSPVRRLANLARKLGGHINGRDFSIKNIAEKFCSDEIRVPDPTVWCHLWAIERKFEELIISRRSIASRDEAVDLLKWLDEFWDFREVKKCLCEYASDKVYGDDQQKARRIIEIVEGK